MGCEDLLARCLAPRSPGTISKAPGNLARIWVGQGVASIQL